MAKKCEFRKKDGARCKANAQAGKSFCVFHDPARVAEGQRARRAGGLRRSRPAAVLPHQTPDHRLGNTTEVSAFLAKSINDVVWPPTATLAWAGVIVEIAGGGELRSTIATGASVGGKAIVPSGKVAEYRSSQTEAAAKLNDQATEVFEQGTRDRQLSDKYVRVTVTLATVLLLMAISQRFKTHSVRLGLLVTATLLLCFPLYHILMLARA
jgi:hypothetical protein